LDAGKYIFVAVIFFSTLLMIVYFWRVIEIMYIKTSKEADAVVAPALNEMPLSMLMPCLSLGILSFVIGIAWISGTFSPLLNAVNASFGLEGAP
jgi:NADH:ubiquinone oxidoreductase subunit 5 (subunit L)/multisubunit Na+/H+ antiporter MnhA subunit